MFDKIPNSFYKKFILGNCFLYSIWNAIENCVLQKIDVLLLFLCVQRCLIKILSDVSKEGDAVVVVGLIHVTSICERLDNVLTTRNIWF